MQVDVRGRWARLLGWSLCLALAGCDLFARPDVPPPPSGVPAIRINEVSCRDGDWVELVSGVSFAQSLEGFVITDGSNDVTHRQELTASDMLLAHGHLSIPITRFGLACGKDTVQVFGRDNQLVEELALPAVLAGQTWGLIPDATGAFTGTVPTAGEPNAVFNGDNDPARRLFDPFTEPVVIDLTLDAASVAVLRAEGQDFQDRHTVAGTFQVTDSAGTDTPVEVGVRLKGKFGSARPFEGKPALRIDFKFAEGSHAYRGIEQLALNNQVQDPSRLHEWLSYRIFRAMGVPAPRLGYAELRVNGQPYGLYVLLETQDDPFLARSFPSTKHVYEGEFTGSGGQDLTSDTVSELDIDEGDKGDRSDLQSLVDAIDAAPKQGFYDALEGKLHWDEVLRMMATEALISHWDGYQYAANNYFLHIDNDGKASLLPWGMDRAFEFEMDFYQGERQLARRCQQDPKCAALYLEQLGAVAAAAQSLPIDDEANAVASMVLAHARTDARAETNPNDIPGKLAETLFILHDRAQAMLADAACAKQPGADADGDGFACRLDCDDNNPNKSLGALDVCGNLVDEDCNGVVDDDASCPVCASVSLGGRDYAFCRNEQTYAQAVSQCAGLGMVVASIDSAGEQSTVQSEARRRFDGDYWIGFTDIAAEGTFVNTSGVALPTAFENFGPGEPNDANNEDCTQVITGNGGSWNDASCDSRFFSVCERL